MNIPRVSRCTAVFVEAHWAVTAGHCLGQRLLGHPAPASAIHLLLGYADGGVTRHLQPDAGFVDPAGADDPEGHRGSDLALLHFAERVADAVAPVTEPVSPGTPLALGGYGQDRAERLLVDRSCFAAGMAADADGRPLLVHDCNGTRGTSGGAVLARVDGQWRLAGVQVAGNLGGAGGMAVPGASVAEFLTRVR